MHNQTGEWRDISQQVHHNAHQHRESNAMEEHVAQNAALMSIPLCGCAGYDDALGVDHLAHYAAGAVG